ncbi:MAG: penicillin-binding protein 1C, partial [Candidatus Zixiibacteriota bacterium]
MKFVAKIRRKHLMLIVAPVLCLILVFLMLDNLIWPLPASKLYRDNAHFIYDRNGQLLNCFASTDHFWRLPLTLDRISPKLISSVIESEDRWFYYHPGFNAISLFQASVENLKAGKVVRGGSTITMQIARMMEPKERTIKSKLIELFRAVQLEMHYSKEELLNFYFNLVPYGGNIEGVGAAAYFYFGKSAQHLSWSEAAILTAIPSSPNQYRPDLSPAGCRARRDVILSTLKERGIIDNGQFAAAIAEEIPTQRYDRPFIAPQFCQTMITQYSTMAAIKTPIDAATQIMCERLAWGHYQSLTEKNIHNLSVVVLDNKSGELLALVGSPDFEDTRYNGQINGATSARSPGSALKPFVYALGLDNGLITPQSRVDDIPISINGYSPDNYDELFRGIVTVRAALIMSLNIPAVNMEQAVDLEQFYNILKMGGLSTLFRKHDEYGLPLVLGSCEVTLLELSNFYATLARGGVYKPVQQIMDVDSTRGTRILSEETSYIISDILSNLRRPELTTSWMDTKDHAVIAWKTGTSYGRKDAWAIGYNPQFTVGVWVGNFNGEGSPYLVGLEAAAPLMLNIFNEITKGKE